MANLTDKKIKDTYEGLIKTNDNNPITGQVELTDGSGNGTGVSVSTDGRVVATGTVSFDSLRDTSENITVTKFVDEADGIVNNDNDTTLPTSAAVKDYVDTHVTAQDLDFQGDSGTGDVDLDSETFEITGSNGITTTALNNTLDIDGSTLETSINTNTGNITTNTSNISTNTSNISNNATSISNNADDIDANETAIAGNTSNISSNATNIATNTSNITTNTGNVATNTANISTNTSDIATNTADIATNSADISTNASGISSNASSISANTTAIQSNDTDIATNTTDIATNASDIAGNTTDIATNTSGIATNVTNIATNAANITSNDTDITALDGRVTANEGDITTNASGIATNVSDISTNAGDISTNATNISTNATNIANNDTDIGTLQTAVATNTSDISTNASGISTNASGISTNVTNIAVNTAKVSNVTTDLSATANGTSLTINSSDGTDASVPAATTVAWGAMTDEDKTKLDGIATGATANTGTVTNVTVGTGLDVANGTTTPDITLDLEELPTATISISAYKLPMLDNSGSLFKIALSSIGLQNFNNSSSGFLTDQGFTLEDGAQIKTLGDTSGSSQSAATLVTENDVTMGGCINWFSQVQNGSFGIYYHAIFKHGTTTAGGIRRTGNSTVSYLTSSDYRLKENVVEITDGIERVKQLKPSKFNFIGEDIIFDGFIAHEVQDVVPESISGEKDEVDDNDEPIYQGIDQSKIVPLLTAALKDAIAKIEDLEARILTLENN